MTAGRHSGFEAIRVLVVDDSAIMRRLLRHQLRTLGVDAIDEAPDGAVACERLARQDYDLLITDWCMPRVSGIDLVRRLRRARLTRRLPIIMASSESRSVRIADAMAAGVNAYLVKPFSAPALRRRLAAVMDAAA